MNEPQRLETQHNGDVTVVRFRDPRITDSLEIEELGRELYQLAAEYSHGKLVLNFSEVEFLSSAVLGKLIRLNGKVKAGGGARNSAMSGRRSTRRSRSAAWTRCSTSGPMRPMPWRLSDGVLPWNREARRKPKLAVHVPAR